MSPAVSGLIGGFGDHRPDSARGVVASLGARDEYALSPRTLSGAGAWSSTGQPRNAQVVEQIRECGEIAGPAGRDEDHHRKPVEVDELMNFR